MRRNIHVALASLGLLLGTAGCNSFLTGDKLSNDPNQPTTATLEQLFVAIQAQQFAFQEGTVPMMMCMWVQACGGTNGRFVEQAGRYVFGESSNIAANNGDWQSVYVNGGLNDLRQAEAAALAAGDRTYLGILKVWEALTMGTASDQWGNIPYSQTTASPTPALDNRFAVLDSVQKLLDQAIADLTSAVGAGPRPGADLVFGGNRANWIKAAWTLKARYYMHTAESLGAPAYTNAINAALSGISDATGNSDLRAFHSGLSAGERNMWGAFQESSSFGQDVVPGQFLDTILKLRADPRLPAYFCELTNTWKKSTKHKVGDLINDKNKNLQKVTAVAGDSSSAAAEPTWATALNGTTTDNNVTWTNVGLPYVGQDFNSPRANTSTFACQPLRFSDTYRMPFVSYAENELILAEANSTAKVNGGAGGDDAVALLHLNNERAYVNTAYPATAGPPATVALPAITGVAGVALFDSIMTEKYVAMFQNIETINDYRRTCIPAVTIVNNSQGFSNVPGRLFYPRTERNVNTNIPDPSAQLSAAGHFFRNPGDVNACTASNAP